MGKTGLLTAKGTTSGPDTSQSLGEAVATVGSHGGLDDLQRLAERRHLKQVQAGAQEQVGELDGLLLQLVARGGAGDGGGSSSHDLVMSQNKGP